MPKKAERETADEVRSRESADYVGPSNGPPMVVLLRNPMNQFIGLQAGR